MKNKNKNKIRFLLLLMKQRLLFFYISYRRDENERWVKK